MARRQSSAVVLLLLLCIVPFIISAASSENGNIPLDVYRDNFGFHMGGKCSITSLETPDQLNNLWASSYPQLDLDNGISIKAPGQYLIKMITFENGSTDLSNKALEIIYCAIKEGPRAIKFFQHDPSSPHRVKTIWFEVQKTFKVGKNHLVIPLTDFNGANLALAQGFGIEGPLFVQNLKLLSDHSTIDSIVLDLRQPVITRKPWHDGWIFLPGVGYQILNDEDRISFPLPRSIGKHMKIRYSADVLGARQVVLVIDDISHGTRARSGEEFMKVMFNPGQNKELVLPLPKTCRNGLQLSTYGVIIQGPLILHEIELLNTPPVLELAPGDSAPDALLIDDFSDWAYDRFNILHLTRRFCGTKGDRSVTLSGPENYLIEYFSNAPESWELHRTAFRITYSTVDAVTCKVSLSRDDIENDANADIEFRTGTKRQVTIPVSDLVTSDKIYMPSPYVSLSIRGPHAIGERAAGEIVLHRIEVMSKIRFQQLLPLPQSIQLAGRHFQS